jgi:multicomponent Na+:H+ antiporter subunit B
VIYTLILRAAVRLLMPLLLLFSIFVLLRGHNRPGGGFVGGLVAAGAFALYAFARGSGNARKVLQAAPRTLLGTGLACALGAGLLALVRGRAFLKSLWWEPHLPGGLTLHLGSTLLFDVGVMSVVVGTVLIMVFAIEGEEQGAALTKNL